MACAGRRAVCGRGGFVAATALCALAGADACAGGLGSPPVPAALAAGAAAEASGNWLSRAQRSIAEREYEASPNGEGLQGRLVAQDASGAALAARFEVPGPGRVRLVVEDAEATYPVAIDPLLTESADAQLESDQANANLGQSVASAGDVTLGFLGPPGPGAACPF